MTYEQIAEALVKWARELIPELEDGYSYDPGVTDRLPDVTAVIATVKDVPSDPENFPFAGLEQTWLRVFDVEMSIMVEVGEGAKEEEIAQRSLEAYAETLTGSTQGGTSLEGEAMISPRTEVDLTEPSAERTDGTRGRAVFLKLAVAQRIEVG